MEMVLKIMGGALGLLVPYLFIVTIYKGIKNSPFDGIKLSKYRNTLFTVMCLWVIIIWILSISGLMSYHAGDIIPRFAIALLVPVLIGLYLIRYRDFQVILTCTPLSTLVGVQIFRFAGSAFLIIANMKILPKGFQMAGYGDILTGAFALFACIAIINKSGYAKLLFWTYSVIGLIDLLNVAFMLLAYYPIWSDAVPSSSAAADFSLVMIPALVAPIALLLHIYSIRNFLKYEK